MGSVIELQNVTKTYHPKNEPSIKALSDVSLSVAEGEFLAVCGVSGSGKSTLLHLIGCLDKPTDGTIIVAGKDVGCLSDREMAAMRNQTVTMVLQDFGLIPYMSVFDNVAVPLFFARDKKDKAGRIRKALELTGIKELSGRIVSQISGGQKQRAAIARAIVNEAPILLADEPTGQLDVKTKLEIIELFKALNNLGKTIVMVTHDVDMAKAADRVIYLSDGKII